MADVQESWSEEDSALYRQLASIAVPDREEQIATLLVLLPFGREERFHVVELGSGQGLLAEALLRAYPNATLTALDGSASMLEETRQRVEEFGERARVAAFDLASPDWLGELDGADVVWASLSIHHLDGPGKQALFREAATRTGERSVFLVADVVEPPNAVAASLFADVYDQIAERQSHAQTGGREAYQAFLDEEWNCYRCPDPVDIPSPLSDQLTWLREAGYAVAGSFWQHAGHAIYGGYQSLDAEQAGARLSFAEALSFAHAVTAALDAPTPEPQE